jgi:hypothetical protein
MRVDNLQFIKWETILSKLDHPSIDKIENEGYNISISISDSMNNQYKSEINYCKIYFVTHEEQMLEWWKNINENFRRIGNTFEVKLNEQIIDSIPFNNIELDDKYLIIATDDVTIHIITDYYPEIIKINAP